VNFIFLYFNKLLNNLVLKTVLGRLFVLRKFREDFQKVTSLTEELPVELVGANWRSKHELPIAILIGFHPWKRQFVSSYLQEFKTAFAHQASLRRIQRDFLSHFSRKQEFVFIFWGNKKSYKQEIYLFSRHRSAKVFTVEDGFLRSMGQAVLHTRPSSLCIDDLGIYFNANKPSRLEKIVEETHLLPNSALESRAEECLQIMRAARITKYYNIKPYSSSSGFKKSNRYSVLVMGQVEGDASIAMSRSRIKNDIQMIKRARLDFPEADVYYRPHPDVWHGTRTNQNFPKWLQRECIVVPPETSVYEIFAIVNHVYTISSLTGFEALIQGLKVTAFGAPFYSNWGQTEDHVKISRRLSQPSIRELFAAAYLRYPRYLHPVSDEQTSFEDVVSHFVVEALKHEDIFALSCHPLYAACLPHAASLSLPFRILCALAPGSGPSSADRAAILALIQREFRLCDFMQISFLLAKTCNYDLLVDFLNLSLQRLDESQAGLSSNTALLEQFLYSFSVALRQTNGRVANRMPNLNRVFLDVCGNDKLFSRILRHYISCLSCGLQYDIIEEFIDLAQRVTEEEEAHWASILAPSINDIIHRSTCFRLSPNHFKIITQALQEKPSRSERNGIKRHQLTMRAAARYGTALDEARSGVLDLQLNRILFDLLRDEDLSPADDLHTFFILCGQPEPGQDECSKEESQGERKLAQTNQNTLKTDSLFSPDLKVKTFLEERMPEVLTICNALIRQRDISLLDRLIDLVDKAGFGSRLTLLKLSRARVLGDKGKFLEIYGSLGEEEQGEDKIATLYARALREWSHFAKSEQEYSRLAATSRTLARRVGLEEEAKKLAFCRRTSEILNSVPQPSLPRGVIFLASQTCFNTLALMTPALVELKKKGYAVVNLVAGMTEHQPTGRTYIDQLAGAIPLDLVECKWRFRWEVDWDAKRVEALGINFYQGFYERLSTASRRYHVRLTDVAIRTQFLKQLKRADTCLHVCELVRESVLGRGLPCSFVTGNSHVTPFSVFRDYARHHDHPRMNFINCNVAYESYFTNLGSKFANTMCVTDMTLYPLIRAPFLARRDQFDNWYARNSNNPEFAEKAASLIGVNRVGSADARSDNELVQELEKAKKAGKKIICAFGKVPVDLNVPFDGGPAHSDMADWLNHTIQVCGGKDDILLLVKPHPHELRPEIALDLVEGLHDLVEVKVPENVKILGHKDINVHALAPYLDLAILYNGSSALELTAMGVPVMMTSHFGKHDYPIDLLYPQSRHNYEHFLLSEAFPAPEQDLRKKAAYLICYLGSDEISIVNQYAIRQITNDKIGVPRWRETEIRNFIEKGDARMELIANRIVEKFQSF
jgi:capsular polysaccharide export protein